MEKQKLGFFSLYDTETPDSYVGALLVTDDHGIPLEFKCTHSVKPTAIQRSLYGDKLQPYVAVTLCGIPLINSIGNKPDILFVDIPYILGIRPNIEISTLLIRRVGESINLQSGEYESDKHKIENELYQAVILQTHPGYKEEAITLNGKINLLFNNFDLIEPFERMKKSVSILGKSDSKFK